MLTAARTPRAPVKERGARALAHTKTHTAHDSHTYEAPEFSQSRRPGSGDEEKEEKFKEQDGPPMSTLHDLCWI